jgi:hypothetical protein
VSRARSLAMLAALMLVGCEDTRGALGEECLRDLDCLSNVCSARTCVARRPVTNELPAPFDAGLFDAGVVAVDSGARD